MDTVERFRKRGYSTSLIYLGLVSIEQSIDRVQHRVRQGGHFVDNYSIRYNYEEGLRNLAYFADRFDTVRVIDASGDYLNLKTLYQAVDREVVSLANELPGWVAESIITMANKLRPGYNREQDDEENRRRGPRR
ncbi:hypothetical protein KHS38_14610 [Mucilaginibacter sp. Bleaf8]|uniref:hypothetical protein n=1 Tax=Mucilaginibacter sp. Bleaf8 TaxID=2834430 RepID=UPI001BCF69C9|nr:hypothetical protein [Mucilaginibacter sp. Bleaf8]MBS7565640.1 hypothetical protein [Mucilaginibacter sp. Bleaf8]